MFVFPVRCFTCGKIIATTKKIHMYKTDVIQGSRSPDEVLDEMRMIRPCCRRMFLTHPWKAEAEMENCEYVKP